MIDLDGTALATRLCVALDMPDRSLILKTAEATQPYAGMFKIGLTTFAALGPSIVGEVRELRPVFVDLKLHDIPAQVSGAIRSVAESGAVMTTVHATGGAAMIAAAVEAGRQKKGFVVAAVTVLTSLDEGDLKALGLVGSASETVDRLADVAVREGIDALVCSSREAGTLRSRFETGQRRGPLLVVPGVRPRDSHAEDQRRTGTPAAAVAAGADILVVGRPITEAANPAEAARAILEEIEA